MKRWGIFLGSVLMIICLIVWISHGSHNQPTVEISKPLIELQEIQDAQSEPGRQFPTPKGLPGLRTIPENTITSGALNKPVNKPLEINDLQVYFSTENIQNKQTIFAESIRKYQRDYAAPPAPALPQESKRNTADVIAGSLQKQSDEAYFIDSNVEGSRVIKRFNDDLPNQRQDTVVANRDGRVVMVELPRRFENFSLGSYYKTNTDKLTWHNATVLSGTVLDSVEGRLFQSRMYYFSLVFKNTVDPYYLAAVLQDILGPALEKKVGRYLIFSWADDKTQVEYIIYDARECKLHFYDIALGKARARG